MKKLLKISLTLFITAIIVLGFALPLNPPNGFWYQQFMPNPAGGQIRDIYFIDSLTGFAVSDSSILKTTSGGDSWAVKLTGYYIFNRIKFINSATGFVGGGNNTILKTTNSGENWTPIILPSIYPFDMSVVSVDSIWLVNTNGLTGGIFRTTNGGANWEQQLNLGSQNPGKIYMYNSRIGFASTGAGLYKTTNSGTNWNNVSGNETFFDMYFKDSLNGWKSRQLMDRTTDGGITWITQTLPTGGNIILNYLLKFAYVKTDTIFGVGGLAIVPNGARGFIYRSINGGNTWEYQIPDTAIHAPQYQYIKNINSNLWAYWFLSGIHTTNGGDPIWLTGIEQISTEIPKKYKLYQNYPNPFNPYTNIKYTVKRETSNVKLIIFDITGREVIKLVDKEQSAGTYKVDWSTAGYSSGVYFYSLIVNGSKIDTKKMILVK